MSISTREKGISPVARAPRPRTSQRSEKIETTGGGSERQVLKFSFFETSGGREPASRSRGKVALAGGSERKEGFERNRRGETGAWLKARKGRLLSVGSDQRTRGRGLRKRRKKEKKPWAENQT